MKMRDVLEITGYIIAFIVACVVVIIIIGIIMTPFFIIDCNRTAKNMEMNHKYDIWSGCYLQLDDGHWVKSTYFVVPELR